MFAHLYPSRPILMKRGHLITDMRTCQCAGGAFSDSDLQESRRSFRRNREMVMKAQELAVMSFAVRRKSCSPAAHICPRPCATARPQLAKADNNTPRQKCPPRRKKNPSRGLSAVVGSGHSTDLSGRGSNNQNPWIQRNSPRDAGGAIPRRGPPAAKLRPRPAVRPVAIHAARSAPDGGDLGGRSRL